APHDALLAAADAGRGSEGFEGAVEAAAGPPGPAAHPAHPVPVRRSEAAAGDGVTGGQASPAPHRDGATSPASPDQDAPDARPAPGSSPGEAAEGLAGRARNLRPGFASPRVAGWCWRPAAARDPVPPRSGRCGPELRFQPLPLVLEPVDPQRNR